MIDFLNALVAFTNFVIVPATAYGAQLALDTLGVTLIYGILRFSNFAHGEIMAFGTMVVLLITGLFQNWGISFAPLPTALLALPFGILATILFVLGTDKVVYQFYRRVKAAPVMLVIVCMGVMFMMNGMIRMIVGTDDRRFADGARFLVKVRDFKEATGLNEGLAIKTTQAITLVVAVITVAALF